MTVFQVLCLAALAQACAPTVTVTATDAEPGATSEASEASAGTDGVSTGAGSTSEGPAETTGAPGTGGGSSTDAPQTTGGGQPGCGDGVLDPGEECDDGAANNDEAACTSACTAARCGDGLLQVGVEICDHGDDNGGYGACRGDCAGLGPRCGDGVIQGEHEDCEPAAIEGEGGGCLTSCRWAASCLEIIADQPAISSGAQEIRPAGLDGPVQVYCEMQADGGGYTFLKYDKGTFVNAVAAEAICAEYGLRLLTPRSPAHRVASAVVAASESIPPVVGSLAATNEYLSMLAIYPVEAGVSCVGEALNAASCPEWSAGDGEVFWMSDNPIPGQPSTFNCEGCSMAYLWTPGGELGFYEAFSNGGVGATSRRFLCMAGDKLPP